MIEWLENYIKRLNKSILLISHDRYFLDQVCDTISELDGGKIYTYHGNYAYFLEKKEEREAQERATIDKAKNTYRKELEWMRRQPKARTTKSKSRQESFYEIEEVAKSKKTDSKMQMTMQMNRLGSKILELENVCKSYDGKLLMENFSYTFKKGEKIGLIGVNGSGKSTLLNIIMDLVKPDKGKVRSGETVVFGYYSQMGMDLPEDKRVIEVVRDIAEYVETGGGNWIGVSQFLNHFNFEGAKQHSFVSKLSGGEKKRLYLLTILLKNPNFLILDEPTNDLDIVTLNILEEFLEGYQGCLLMVTHDRYFMDRLVDHVFVLNSSGNVRDIHGNYTDYRELYNTGSPSKVNKSKEKEVAEIPKVVNAEKKKGKLNFKEQQELKSLEGELEKLEEEKKDSMIKMSDGSLSHDELLKIGDRYKVLEKLVEEKMARWMDLQELGN
jgi:ATP-binding cassette subfamily F protein uup